MEFLKPLLGDGLYAQVAEKLEGSGVKLADLAAGGYVGKEKYEALAGQLREAQASAGLATEKAEREMAEARMGLAAEAFAAGVAFTSKAARQAFVEGLKKQGLPLDRDGRLEGAEAFLKKARTEDPTAFLADPAEGAGFEGKSAPKVGGGENPEAAIRAVMFPGR